jgi:hypothetical protein
MLFLSAHLLLVSPASHNLHNWHAPWMLPPFLGSMTQVKNLDPPEVCKDRHSVFKDTASFLIIPQMSFSKDSEDNSAQVSV